MLKEKSKEKLEKFLKGRTKPFFEDYISRLVKNMPQTSELFMIIDGIQWYTDKGDAERVFEFLFDMVETYQEQGEKCAAEEEKEQDTIREKLTIKL
jgi:hypothetical protein